MLQQHLETSESQRQALLETCLQKSQVWAQERPVLACGALPQQETRELSESLDRAGPVGEGGEPGKVETAAEKELALGEITLPAAEEGLPHQVTSSERDLQALQGELQALASGKAEAEAQAGLAQQKLQSLQAMLGSQTERLAQAMEAQKGHMEGLLADAEEKDQLLKSLSRELEKTQKELDKVSAERRRLQAALGCGEGGPCVEIAEAVEAPQEKPPMQVPPEDEINPGAEDALAEHRQEDQQRQASISLQGRSPLSCTESWGSETVLEKFLVLLKGSANGSFLAGAKSCCGGTECIGTECVCVWGGEGLKPPMPQSRPLMATGLGVVFMDALSPLPVRSWRPLSPSLPGKTKPCARNW